MVRGLLHTPPPDAVVPLAETGHNHMPVPRGLVASVLPPQRRIYDLEDPAGKDITVVRRVRDEIKTRIEALVSELDVNV